MNKKILLFFILLLLPVNTQAVEFFTNYELIKESTSEFFEQNELIKREEYILYNNYKDEVINEGYYELGNNPINTPFVNMNDSLFIYENYQENNLNGKEIYNLSKIYKNVLTKLRYIKIRMIDCPTAILTEINIYYEDNLIEYDFIDNVYNFDRVLKPNEELIIDLVNQYDVSKIKLELLFQDEKMNNIEYKLSVSQKGYNFTYPTMYLTNKLDRYNIEEKVITEFLQEDDFIEKINDINWIKDKDITNFNYYKNEKILYKYFNYCKNYLNKYTSTPLNGYKHDLLDKKTVYDYYQREKITIEDNITDLNLIIKNTTINNEEDIKTNIIYEDFNKGVIKITYKDNVFYHKFNLLDKDLNKEDYIVVDKGNDVISTNINDKDINSEKKEILEFKEESTINNEINKHITTIKSNISINYEDNNKVIRKNSFINNNYIYLLIFIFLIIILLIFDKYIHKKKN